MMRAPGMGDPYLAAHAPFQCIASLKTPLFGATITAAFARNPLNLLIALKSS
jgi:hypothetical protein